MSAAHTLGPWAVDPDHCCDNQANGAEIGSAWEARHAGGRMTLRGCVTASPEEAKANARLMAASPTLLALAERAAALIPHTDLAKTDGNGAAELVRDLRAAIAAAKGEAA